MRGRMLVMIGAIVAALVTVAAAASHYGYATTERRLLLAELAQTRESANRATAKFDDVETQLLRTKDSLLSERFRARAMIADLAQVREQQRTSGIAFAQLEAMWEGERDERAIYKGTLQTSAARLAGRDGEVVASELLREIDLRIQKVNAGLERAAKDVLVSEEILAVRPSAREIVRYHERLSLLDTRGWAAARMAENLVAFVRENRGIFTERNPQEGERPPSVLIAEKCAAMKDDAGTYRRAARASVDAYRETSCSLGMKDGWIATDLIVREGEQIAMTVEGLLGVDHTNSQSGLTFNSAVRLRVQGSEVEYPGTIIIRPTSAGRIEIAVDNEAKGHETDQAVVRMWTFRPLTGGG